MNKKIKTALISVSDKKNLKLLLKSLNNALHIIFKKISKKYSIKKVILFSPSAASFDQFKNFEDRGKYFNKVIKRRKVDKKFYSTKIFKLIFLIPL